MVISFAMLAQFFFMALYMQNILGYDALQAGIRFLPSTLLIIVIAPLAGRLSDRIGPKPLMLTGLVMIALSLFLQSHITVDTGYARLLPTFMILGAGIALTMSPMSTAAMNAVEVSKAGVASGVLSMSRMVGGSLGVAVTGALFASAARGRLDELLSGTPQASWPHDRMIEAVSSGQASSIGHGASKAQIADAVHAARDAFIHGLTGTMRLSVAVVVVGIVLASLLIKGRGLPAQRRVEERHPEAIAEPLGAQ